MRPALSQPLVSACLTANHPSLARPPRPAPSRFASTALLAALAGSLAACGHADFSSGGRTGGAGKSTASLGDPSGNGNSGGGVDGNGVNSGGKGTGVNGGLPLSSLTWFWQCDTSPGTVPKAASAADPVIVDGGSHNLVAGQLDKAPLTFSGHMCKPAAMPRDMLFVIDVSGSMAQNDPRVGDTCGRLTAIQAVIASVPAGIAAQYSLITFDSSVETASTAFVANEAALLKDVAPSGNIADVVCGAGTDTNYQAALTQANTILATGRDNATKEIYFVSDGEPTSGLEGVAEAAALRNVGVHVGSNFITATIATVMLNGTGAAFEIGMSSKDPQGNPLHADVNGAANLTAALTALAANGISSADLKYYPIGTTNITTVDLKPHLQGFDFTLPSITMTHAQAPNGLHVIYEYLDQHDNRYASEGDLLWTAATTTTGGTTTK